MISGLAYPFGYARNAPAVTAPARPIAMNTSGPATSPTRSQARLIGVWSLAPDRAWGGRPGVRHVADPNGILAYIARVLPPIGIIVGMYIFWAGADHPGGKFQGATILAAMWLLVMMAGLTDAPPISRAWLRIGLVAGPLVFIAIGLAGAVAAGAFLAYPDGYAKPLIIVIELALMPTLALILALLLVGAPQRTMER